MKFFKLSGTRKCTLYLALVCVFRGADERGHK